MKDIRAFIGISFSNELKESIYAQIEPLMSTLKQVKWVEKENLHINIKFLESIDAKQILLVNKILDKVSERFNSFSLKSGGVMFFPNENKPRVMSLQVQENQPLIEIYKFINLSLYNRNVVRSDKRKFTPHITLARIKTALTREQVDMIKQQIHINATSLINEITLFQSTLTETGPIYKSLHSIRLL